MIFAKGFAIQIISVWLLICGSIHGFAAHTDHGNILAAEEMLRARGRALANGSNTGDVIFFSRSAVTNYLLVLHDTNAVTAKTRALCLSELGWFLYKAPEFVLERSRATNYLFQAIALDPQDAKLNYKLGAVLLQTAAETNAPAEYELAKHFLRRALNLDSNFCEVYFSFHVIANMESNGEKSDYYIKEAQKHLMALDEEIALYNPKAMAASRNLIDTSASRHAQAAERPHK